MLKDTSKKIDRCEIVLFNPPFFRFCGSHNDRTPLSLCYLSRFLENAKLSHVVFNGDYTGAKVYWRWKWMFDNFQAFQDAVDNKGSLYGGVIEGVMGFSPKVVVVMAGEILYPTTDLGNPFIGANFSKRLRELGVFTIGVGPFYTLQPEKFKKYFDCLILGEPSKDLVEIIKSKKRGIIKVNPIANNVVPNLDHLFPEGQRKDILMTSFGCAYKCSFCQVPLVSPKVRFIESETILKDLRSRQEKKIYLGDLTFNLSAEHLREIRNIVKTNNIRKEFTAEIRVDLIDEEKTKLLKEIGVKTVKIGIEGVTQKQLDIFNKKTSRKMIMQAYSTLKKAGFKIVGYFILGGDGIKMGDYKETIKFLKSLSLDYIVINIWSYDINTDYRYDTHFSPVALARWKIPKQVFYKYLEFQRSMNPTVGNLIG